MGSIKIELILRTSKQPKARVPRDKVRPRLHLKEGVLMGVCEGWFGELREKRRKAKTRDSDRSSWGGGGQEDKQER